MNKTKRTLITCFAVLSAAALIGCANQSQGGGETSSASVYSAKRIEMTVKHATIKEGSSFYDGAVPTVVYHDDTISYEEDMTDYSFKIKYSIVDAKDSTKTYEAGDSLPAGDYIATARWNSKNIEGSVRFTVSPSSAETASEGHGYHTVTAESMSSYAVGKHSALGALGAGKTPCVGTPKILVVPVAFSNVGFPDEAGKVKQTLNEAFFADSEDTVWESLSSYYKKASYGKLTLGGEVTDIFTYSGTTTRLSAASSVVSEVETWLKKTYDMKDYDYDGDGYMDGIELVYATDQPTPSTSGSSSDLWWNFTSTMGSSPSTSSPSIHRYFWSRYDYVTNSYYGMKAVDAHTIVHETGHMMGMNDYYSYDKTEGPAGCVDMMDMNVGDHNAYSKMAYNWVDAKVVDGTSDDFNITLNSYTDTGDFLVVRNSSEDPWNETPWDEYLIVEYYTPTGVNEKDSTGYGEWQQASSTGKNAYGHGGTYEKPGVQVFHVDARLSSTTGTYDTATKKKKTSKTGYTDHLYDTEVYNADGTYESAAGFPHDNTPSRSFDAETGTSGGAYREIHAILPSGVNSLDGSTYYNTFGEMTNLFGCEDYVWSKDQDASSKTKSYYGGDNYSNFKMRSFYPNDLKFDDGSVNDWTFQVIAQTDSTVTLHFVKNG